jgi:transposase
VTEDEIDELVAGLPPEAKLIVSILREQNARQAAQNARQAAQIERLSEQIDKLQQMLFGRRSEKMPPIDKVLRDAEPPTETVDGTPMPEDEEARKKEMRRRRRKDSAPKRIENRARRKALPVLEHVIEVRDDQLPSGMTRDDFREVGKGTIIERIEHVPSRYIRQRFILQTLASKDGEVIIKAQAPAGVSEGCHYGPGTHAHVVTAKCCDSLPLHRIAKQLRREGNPIARSTLCSVFHRSAELLRPIHEALLEAVRADGLVQADETTLPVQAKGGCTRGWIWMMMSARAIAYTYATTRGGVVAEKLLGDTQGHMVVDGYSGYNGLAESGRTRCGCWAHTRRKFFEARSSAPEADEALKLIQKLYRVERQAAKRDQLGTKQHAKMRTKTSGPIVNELERWVAERLGRYPPKSPMASALGYLINHRVELRRFLDDPLIPLDNNAAERALRIVALGRKNFLFAGHDEGAQNLAVLQSIVASCQLHDVNPYEYIRDVLVRVQEPGVTLDELMPWAWSAQAE